MRLLIVEDDRKSALALEAGLQREGFSVTLAGTGEEGFYLLGTDNFDLVLLDWMLPGRDGLEILKAARARGTKTPILLLTARNAIADRVLGLESGADDYLVKPFAFGELVAPVGLLKAADELTDCCRDQSFADKPWLDVVVNRDDSSRTRLHRRRLGANNVGRIPRLAPRRRLSLMCLAPLVPAARVRTRCQRSYQPTIPATPGAVRARAARNVLATASVHGPDCTLVSPAWQVSKVIRKSRTPMTFGTTHSVSVFATSSRT